MAGAVTAGTAGKAGEDAGAVAGAVCALIGPELRATGRANTAELSREASSFFIRISFVLC